MSKILKIEISLDALTENSQNKKALRHLKPVLEKFPDWKTVFDFVESKATSEEILTFSEMLNDFITEEVPKLKDETNSLKVLEYSMKKPNGLDFMKFMIKTPYDFRQFDKGRKGLLHKACNDEQFAIVKLLLEHSKELRLDLNATDEFTCTAFHEACEQGNLEIVVLFVNSANELGIDLNVLHYNGLTPLHSAVCESKSVEVVKFLLEHATSVSSHDDIDYDHNLNGEFAKIDVNKRDVTGQTPFHTACSFGLVEIVKLFLDYYGKNKIDINTSDRNGDTPLHLACKYGHVKIVKRILQHYKDNRPTMMTTNPTDNLGQTPFITACIGRTGPHIKVVKLFLEKSEDLKINLRYAHIDNGRNVFHVLCGVDNPTVPAEYVEVLKLLLKHAKSKKIDVNAVDNSGCTPYDVACEYGNHEMQKILKSYSLKNKIEFDFKNPKAYVDDDYYKKKKDKKFFCCIS